MAGKGTYAAYQQLRPSGDGLSQDIKYWNEDATAKRKEQADIDTAEQKRIADRQAKINERRDSALKSIGSMENYDTGSMSLNTKIADTILRAKDQMKELIPIIENPDGYSRQEVLNAQVKFDNLLKTPDNLALTTKFMTDRDNGYKKAVEEGTVFRDLGYEKTYQEGYKNTFFGFDKNGSILVATKDDNEDGKFDINDNLLALEDLKNGVIDFDYSFQKKIDREGLAKDIASAVATDDITTDNGYRSVQIEQGREESINDLVDKSIYTEDGRLTDYAKSELRNKGVDAQNQEALDVALSEIETELKNSISNYIDYTKKENVTPRSSSRTKQSGPTGVLGEQVEPSADFWTGIDIDPENSWAVDLPSGAKIASLKVGDKNYTNAEARVATIDKNGDLALNIVYQNFKSSRYGKPKAGKESAAERLIASVENLEKIQDTRELNAAEEKMYQDTLLQLESITTSPENDEVNLVIPKELQASVARQLGTTIESIRQKATKNKDPNAQQEKPTTQLNTANVPEGGF